MKHYEAIKSKERLERILLQEKIANPTRLSEILRAETTQLLSSYMSLEKVDFCVNVDENGKYQIEIKARANRLYDVV